MPPFSTRFKNRLKTVDLELVVIWASLKFKTGLREKSVVEQKYKNALIIQQLYEVGVQSCNFRFLSHISLLILKMLIYLSILNSVPERRVSGMAVKIC